MGFFPPHWSGVHFPFLWLGAAAPLRNALPSARQSRTRAQPCPSHRSPGSPSRTHGTPMPLQESGGEDSRRTSLQQGRQRPGWAGRAGAEPRSPRCTAGGTAGCGRKRAERPGHQQLPGATAGTAGAGERPARLGLTLTWKFFRRLEGHLLASINIKNPPLLSKNVNLVLLEAIVVQAQNRSVASLLIPTPRPCPIFPELPQQVITKGWRIPSHSGPSTCAQQSLFVL